MANPFLEHGSEPADTELIFVRLPAAIEPNEREERYGDPLDAELRLAGIGYVSGGGQLLGAPDEHGNRYIIYAGVDIDTTDIDATRNLLRAQLLDLGCPLGTLVQYRNLQDRYDGEWQLSEPRVDDD